MVPFLVKSHVHQDYSVMYCRVAVSCRVVQSNAGNAMQSNLVSYSTVQCCAGTMQCNAMHCRVVSCLLVECNARQCCLVAQYSIMQSRVV